MYYVKISAIVPLKKTVKLSAIVLNIFLKWAKSIVLNFFLSAHPFAIAGNCNSAVTGKATERISFAEWHAMLFAKLGLLVDLIQIMYQNRKESPFQTRPTTMAISVSAVCISGFAVAALLKSKAVRVEEEDEQTTGHFLYCHRILDMLVLISGIVTLSCLVSVFIPDGLGWIVFVSYASTISALVMWHFLFLPIFRRTKSGHGESRPNMV